MGYNRFCFHGTHKKNIISIMDSGFKPSNSEIDDRYLGKGIYFMEDDPVAPIRFCTGIQKMESDEVRVIQANIISNNYLDLIQTEEFDEYVVFAKELENRLKSENKEPDITPGMILNYIFENHYQFDFVRHSFQLPIRPFYKALKRHNIYVCVKIKECINTIEEVKNNGKTS